MATTQDPWYKSAKGDAHRRVFETADFIRSQQTEQREDWVHYMELYSDCNITGLGSVALPERRLREYWDSSTGKFNLTRAMVDTAISLISQSPAVPQYLTTDGSFKLARKAEKCSQVLQGQMNREVQEVMKRAHLDACKVGTGFVFGKLDPMTGLPVVERVHPLETLVEHFDGYYQDPRSLHRPRLVPKAVLAAQNPKYEDEIMSCPGPRPSATTDLLLEGLTGLCSYDDFVEVIESWHRKCGKKKGRHTICIANATLLDHEYKHEWFPCAVFRYRERDFGFYGSGLIESCRDAQIRINDLIRRVARGQDLASNIVIMNPTGPSGEGVKTEVITNDIGIIINYDAMLGAAPQVVKWDGTMDDLQNQIDLEFQRSLAVEGLSQEQVNGQGAGRGLESGVAVRAADDVQSRRLVPFVSRYQSSCIGCAKLFERLNDDALLRNSNYVPRSENKNAASRFLSTSRWADVRLPEGDATLSMGQMSALPTTPQGRWSAVTEWIRGGFMSRQFAMKQLDFPDIDAYATIELAYLDLAKYQIEQILDGELPDIEPRQDLNLAIDLMSKSKARAIIMGADDEIIDNFETWIVWAEDAMEQAIAREAEKQAALQGGAPGAAGPGAPVGNEAPGVVGSLELPMGNPGVVAPGLGGAPMG